MLGGQFRDRVRLYADTTQSADGTEAGRHLKEPERSWDRLWS